MADVLLRGGRVIDSNGERRADVLVAGSKVQAVAEGLSAPSGALVLDVGGCVVSPGLVDLHCHLREPGQEESECVETGSRSAALGGYTAVVAMPNTDPPVDSGSMVRDLAELGRSSLVEMAVAGAITVGRNGSRLAPMAEMASLGVKIFTDDGAGVQDSALMRNAMEYAAGIGVTIAEHAEDASLAAGGQMHEGSWSSRLGLPGSAAVAEEVMVARDLALARLTGARLHLMHLSTAGSIALVRQARMDGIQVTAEVTPHHLSLTDGALASYDPNLKMSPPLRSAEDVNALRAGVAQSVVDAIATDHAPHPLEAKEVPFADAANGVIGLETALAVALTVLVSGSGPFTADVASGEDACVEGASAALGAPPDGAVGASGLLGIQELLALMSWKPARIACLDHSQGGPVVPGSRANICVVDLDAAWVVDPDRFASRSRNTPFRGWKLLGKVLHTICNGEPVVLDGEPQR
ncbi:MAG: dihydroorotase [Acidimicrobiales bacterium]